MHIATSINVMWFSLAHCCVVSTSDLTRHVSMSIFVLSVPMISHDTSQRVVSCCQYQWSHTMRLKEFFRVVSTNDLTRHVSKSFIVLSVTMISHDTSQRVFSCCQYQWFHTKRLKESFSCCQYQWSHTTRLNEDFRFVSTSDLTRHVSKSFIVLSVPMISHDTSQRVVSCCQYRWSATTRKMSTKTTTRAPDFPSSPHLLL